MKVIAIDIETTGLGWNDKILSIAASKRDASGKMVNWSWSVNAADLFNQPTPIPQIRHELLGLMADADLIAMHNAAFDLSYLLGAGILQAGEVNGRLFDTMLTARMVKGWDSVSLANLATAFQLGNSAWEGKKSQRGKLNSIPVDALLEYNAEDTAITAELAERVWSMAEKAYAPDFVLRESDFSRLMAEVRVRGKAMSKEKVDDLHDMLVEEKGILYNDLLFPKKIQGANDRSGILRWLAVEGITGLPTTAKGNATINEESLINIRARLDDEKGKVIDGILRARHIEKALATWIDGLWDEADGLARVHANYMVGGTVSFRLSCSKPNLQAVPKRYDMWAPYVSADYSQAELRLAAMYAAENNMAREFSSGADFHAATSTLMFGNDDKENRTLAKRCNFASIYNAGARKLAMSAGISEDLAAKLKKQHRKVFPGLARMSRIAEQSWIKNGYLTLISGKRLYATQEDLRERSYKAFNQLIQGGVAEMIKEAMFQLDDAGIRIVNQVHDSLEFDHPTDIAEVRRIMRSVIPDKIQRRTDPVIDMAVDIDVFTDERS